MKYIGLVIAFCALCLLTSCVVVPVKDNSHGHVCQLSSDKKTLKVVDVANETNSYYSVSGLLLTPITLAASAIVSGGYVLVNNTYHIGEEQIKCG